MFLKNEVKVQSKASKANKVYIIIIIIICYYKITVVMSFLPRLGAGGASQGAAGQGVGRPGRGHAAAPAQG